jgi:hypothetical protein
MALQVSVDELLRRVKDASCFEAAKTLIWLLRQQQQHVISQGAAFYFLDQRALCDMH